MLNQNKFKLFTLVELIVVMLLSVTVFSFVGFAYYKTSTLFSIYSEKKKYNQNVTYFIDEMSRYFETSKSVQFDNKVLTIKFNDTNSENIEINFQDKFLVLKKGNLSDTLVTEVTMIEYEKESQLKPHFIKSFRFSIVKNGNSQDYSFYKVYDNSIYLNMEEQ